MAESRFLYLKWIHFMIHTKYYKSKNVFNTKLSNILNYMVLCVKSNLKNIMSIMNSKCNSRFKGQPFYQLHKNYPMYFGPTFRNQIA